METVFNKKTHECEVRIKIDDKKFKSMINKIFEEKAKKIIVPGFRPGKAPMSKISARIDTSEVTQEALDKLIKENASEAFQEALKINKSVQPELVKFDTINWNKEGEEKQIVLSFPVYVTLDDVKISKVDQKIKFKSVSTKDVEQELKNRLEQFALLLPVEKDGKTQLDDTVVIDFKGYVDNEPFDGGEATNYSLKLGSKSFIEGFEDQLIGKKLGWSGKIKVTFPKEYFSNHLKGKNAEFEVTIHEIKRPSYEINEQILEKIAPGSKTEEEAKKYLKSILAERKLFESLEEFYEEVKKEIIAKNKFEFHRSQLKPLADEQIKNFENSLKTSEIKKKEYLEVLGKTEQDIIDESYEMAKHELENFLVSRSLFEKFQKEPTSEEIEKEYSNISALYNVPVEELKKNISLDKIKEKIQTEKVTEKIYEFFDKEGYAKFLEEQEKIKAKKEQKVKKETKEEKTTAEKNTNKKVAKTTKK